MKYPVLMEVTSTGYSACAPDLPGCIAAAETWEETIQLMKEALSLHLDAMLQSGEPLPEPSILEYVNVQAV